LYDVTAMEQVKPQFTKVYTVVSLCYIASSGALCDGGHSLIS